MRLYALLTVLLLNNCLNAQQKGTGLIFDPPSIRTIPYKAKLTSESYSAIPAFASLEKYCPTPGDQGQYGTCVAFATAYHLRTILHTQSLNNVTPSNSTSGINANNSIFSPTFVYEQIKNKTDINCEEGSNPVDAFELLKSKGAAKLSTQPYACGVSVKKEALREGLDFRISDYQILFYPDETDSDFKINSTKKALSEGYPCMLGFIVPESFYSIKGDVWKEQRSDNGSYGQHGRHAMCVVGYDDKKYGGSFRVLNSWGTSWADKGFVWIPYQNFAKYAIMVIQAYGPPKPKPIPDPKPDEPVMDVLLKGDVFFKQNTGEDMNVTRTLTRNLVIAGDGPEYNEELVAYKMENAYNSGTRFRFYINTNTETYVYAFATDLSGKVNKILPFADNMSPRIGKESTVAFPSETKVVKMDDNPGTDYLLILYSKQPLNTTDMLLKMNAVNGGLSAKIKAALGEKLILPSDINYHATKAGFDLKEKHSGTVVPLMVEISHR